MLGSLPIPDRKANGDKQGESCTMLTWLEWLRRWIANPKYAGSNPVVNSKYWEVVQWQSA